MSFAFCFTFFQQVLAFGFNIRLERTKQTQTCKHFTPVNYRRSNIKPACIKTPLVTMYSQLAHFATGVNYSCKWFTRFAADIIFPSPSFEMGNEIILPSWAKCYKQSTTVTYNSKMLAWAPAHCKKGEHCSVIRQG